MPKQKPPVSKNESVILQIQGLGAEGQGIGRTDSGYAIFVPGALPGETVRAHIIKVGASFAVAKLLEIVHASRERVEPACAIHGRCGGCALQHYAYKAQLVYKQQLVRDALMRIGGFSDIEVQPVIGMQEPYYYRNKASFPFATVNGKVELGFFAPRTHRVVPTEDCLIQQENVFLTALAVRDWANAYHIPTYDEESGGGLLRHVIVRAGSSNDLMAVVVSAGELLHTEALIEHLMQIEGMKSIYLNINREDTNVIQGQEYRLLYGAPRISERMLGLDFTLGPASFLQVNHVQAERLYTVAMDCLAPSLEETVVDAYCGIGTITLQLAKHTKNVIGIEDIAEAVIDARENARINGVGNARFICGAAEKELPKLLKSGIKIDALLMDPPRKGADEAFIHALIKSDIPRIAYISCNPATLARDLKLLAAGGYKLEFVQPVDMFPQTGHVETVVLMSRVDK